MNPTSFSLEEGLATLETIVLDLEKNDTMSMDARVKQYTDGVRLAHQCHQALKDAKQKISILDEESAQLKEYPMNEAE